MNNEFLELRRKEKTEKERAGAGQKPSGTAEKGGEVGKESEKKPLFFSERNGSARAEKTKKREQTGENIKKKKYFY